MASSEWNEKLVPVVSALLGHFWMRVDRIVPGNPSDLFEEAGGMHLGMVSARGRAEIEAYFRARHASETTTGRHTRHLFTNLWIEDARDGIITARSLITVHAGVGELPLTSRAPSTIADFRYRLIQDTPDILIARIDAKAIFVGDGALNHQS